VDIVPGSLDIAFWRTRDGDEVDFLVEARGHVTPIEVKLGTPDVRALPRLSKIAEPSWQPGRVVSLSTVALAADQQPWTTDWLAASPLDLTFLG